MKTTFLYLLLLFEVPRPEASTPPPVPPPPVGIRRRDFPRLLCFPGVPPPLGSHHADSGQRPTPVNARGPYGTQAPQSRAVNLFSEETMASRYRPTWPPMIGQEQCTEVTPSCSCCNQRTRGLIMWLGLNVACASQVYVKSLKNARSMHCSIT